MAGGRSNHDDDAPARASVDDEFEYDLGCGL
jgi:hypothetical protein